MQRIGGKSWHREVRKLFHQAAVSQKIGNSHSKLVGDAGCVECRLSDRAAIVRIEWPVRDHALSIGESERPWPSGSQIAQAGMRTKILDSLGMSASFEIGRRGDENPVEVNQLAADQFCVPQRAHSDR